MELSELIAFDTLADLATLREGARAASIEGLMLKHAASPYLPGRPRGHWWKWKRAPLTIDAVLMYAQRGHGKRSSYYSDYTFGVWTDGENGPELVPVGKAYFGFTDEELTEIDRFVRNNTVSRCRPRVRGGVRGVEPVDAAPIGRGDALSQDFPAPLGQAAGRGGSSRNAGSAAEGLRSGGM
jgi:ATP-dependent DNA ligase